MGADRAVLRAEEILPRDRAFSPPGVRHHRARRLVGTPGGGGRGRRSRRRLLGDAHPRFPDADQQYRLDLRGGMAWSVSGETGSALPVCVDSAEAHGSAQPSAILRLSRFLSGFTDGSSLPFDPAELWRRISRGLECLAMPPFHHHGAAGVRDCRPFNRSGRSFRTRWPISGGWGRCFRRPGCGISFRGVVRIPAILFGEASGRAGRRDTATAPVAPLISKVKSGPRSARHGRDIRTVLTYLKAAYVHHTRKPIEPDVPEAAGSLRTVYRQGSPRSTISGSSELTGRDLGWFFRNGCGKVCLARVQCPVVGDGGWVAVTGRWSSGTSAIRPVSFQLGRPRSSDDGHRRP